jgi:hypothetical protein
MSYVQPKEAGGPTDSRSTPPRAPHIYGLTPEGKAVLESAEAEVNAQTYDLLRVRDRRAGDMPTALLTHDLLTAAWIANLVDHVRRVPMLHSVAAYTEYVSVTDGQGKPKQRFDGLVVLRFNPKQKQQVRAGWDIPWEDDSFDPAWPTFRFALETDRGTEKLAILLDKALMYKSATEGGYYRKTLGGDVVPVVLAPPGRRSAQIGREFVDAWPTNPGLISSFKKAAHPTYGVPMGTYYTMQTSPNQHVLLGKVAKDCETWARLTAGWIAGDVSKP